MLTVVVVLTACIFFFLKKCKPHISFPLSIIFNKSLSKGIFPDKWKEACIILLHKKGDATLAGNYRPISVLSTISKLFEKFGEGYVVKKQHGFQFKWSAITNLLEVTTFELLIPLIILTLATPIVPLPVKCSLLVAIICQWFYLDCFLSFIGGPFLFGSYFHSLQIILLIYLSLSSKRRRSKTIFCR